MSGVDLTGMHWIAPGHCVLGSDHHYAEESPAFTADVEGFWMVKTPVTNLQFGQFVEATGHITLAEIAPTIADYPDADPALLRAGSAVFRGTTEPVTLNDHSRW